MAKFVGGPCDGRDTGANFNATISCGGISYTRGAGGNYYPDTDADAAVGAQVLGTHAPKAWHDLQVSVNRRLPTALQRSRRIRRGTLRTINRRRRVG